MAKIRNTCRETTVKGRPCKNQAEEGLNFCRHHIPESKLIPRFLADHWEGFAGFLAGALSDPVVEDLYEYLKKELGMESLVPPVPASKKGEQRIAELSRSYKIYRDLDGLSKLVPLLRLGMERSKVHALLGHPMKKGPEVGVDFYVTDSIILAIDYKHVGGRRYLRRSRRSDNLHALFWGYRASILTEPYTILTGTMTPTEYRDYRERSQK